MVLTLSLVVGVLVVFVGAGVVVAVAIGAVIVGVGDAGVVVVALGGAVVVVVVGGGGYGWMREFLKKWPPPTLSCNF